MRYTTGESARAFIPPAGNYLDRRGCPINGENRRTYALVDVFLLIFFFIVYDGVYKINGWRRCATGDDPCTRKKSKKEEKKKPKPNHRIRSLSALLVTASPDGLVSARTPTHIKSIRFFVPKLIWLYFSWIKSHYKKSDTIYRGDFFHSCFFFLFFSSTILSEKSSFFFCIWKNDYIRIVYCLLYIRNFTLVSVHRNLILSSFDFQMATRPVHSTQIRKENTCLKTLI